MYLPLAVVARWGLAGAARGAAGAMLGAAGGEVSVGASVAACMGCGVSRAEAEEGAAGSADGTTLVVEVADAWPACA
jgi:hypothetical protein